MGSAGAPIRISYRYPADPYDRVWFYPKMVEGWSRLQTNLTVRNYEDGLKLPSMAMMTAIMPNGSDIMYFNWTSSQDNQLFHVYKHNAELVPNSVREMTACCGSSCYGPFVPPYLKMENSALPPILNAIEIYTVLQRSKTTTNQEDVTLNGEISSHIGDLKSLESLNLSNNSLEDQVPEFLAKLI
ncbi:hypothetical protein AAC387_Pa03g4428 [Persea americana]